MNPIKPNACRQPPRIRSCKIGLLKARERNWPAGDMVDDGGQIGKEGGDSGNEKNTITRNSAT